MWDIDTYYIYFISNKGVIMPDYEEMYLKMFRASEQAASILIAAQRECEELYIALSESDSKASALKSEYDKNTDDK
jgi:hypothetical protein